MYIPPPRNIDFDRSANAAALKAGWHDRVARQIDSYRNFPRVLDPLAASPAAIQDSVTWDGFPRALDAWYDIENVTANRRKAHEAAEILYQQVPVVVSQFGRTDRVVFVPIDVDRGIFLAPERVGGISPDDAFGIAERPQDEYLEWHVVRDQSTGKVLRIDYTSEPPEYWEFLAKNDSKLTVEIYSELVQDIVEESDLFFPGDVLCPRFRVAPGVDPQYVEHVRLADQDIEDSGRFEAGRYNPSNVWNTSRGAVHLIQRNNTLFAEINLAANATRKFAARPTSGTPIDRFTLTACGGFGGVNRNSDPSIGEFVNTLSLDDHRVMVSNPIGLFIAEVKLGMFRDPSGNPVADDEILTTVRGDWEDEPGRARVVRFSVHPPEAANYTLDQCTFNGEPLDTGGPIARETLIAVHGIAEPNDPTNPFPENPEQACEAGLVEHPTLRPKLIAGVNWAQRMQVSVPEDTISGATTRSMIQAIEDGRGL